MLNALKGIYIGMLKLFLLLYADDTIIMAETEEELIKGLSLLEEYWDKWKVCVNTNKICYDFQKRGTTQEEYYFFVQKPSTRNCEIIYILRDCIRYMIIFCTYL